MKNRRGIFLCSVVAALAAAVAWLAWPSEPSYQGRSLSEWLDDLSELPLAPPMQVRMVGTNLVGYLVLPRNSPPLPWPGLDTVSRRKAVEAMRAMGINALPHLLDRMNTTDTAFRKKLIVLATRQSFLRIRLRSAPELRRQARDGICAMGRPAMPVMERFLEDPTLALHAAFGLSQVGSEAVEPLMRALTNDNKRIRDAAVAGLSRMQSDAARIVPTMMTRLRDQDPVHRKNAAMVLGSLGSDAKPAVPLLVKMLGDEEMNARAAAQQALKLIGSEASSGTAAK